MNIKEVRELTSEELQNKLKEQKAALFNLRFQHAINQLDNPTKIVETKRDKRDSAHIKQVSAICNNQQKRFLQKHTIYVWMRCCVCVSNSGCWVLFIETIEKQQSRILFILQRSKGAHTPSANLDLTPHRSALPSLGKKRSSVLIALIFNNIKTKKKHYSSEG